MKKKGKKAGDKSEKKKDTVKDVAKEDKPKDEEAYDERADVATLTAEPEAVEDAAEAPDKAEDKAESPDKVAEESKKTDSDEDEDAAPAEVDTPSRPLHGRQPSLSIQSKMRSTSFRQASGGMPLSPSAAGGSSSLAPLSPDGNAMGEIYRKQASRLDELEKENRRLTKDLEASENRWRKAEEELEELRSSNVQIAELRSRAKKAETQAEEINKLVSLAAFPPTPFLFFPTN